MQQEIFNQYQDAGWAVIPVNKKVPLIKDWNGKSFEELADEKIPANTTGIGVVLGQHLNRRLACVDVDCNDPEICERLIANFPFHVRCYGAKGFKAFFLTDGDQIKELYKFLCPGNSGFIEVFYSNRQLVLPPSLHPDGHYYTWHDDAASLLAVGYDNLPVITHDMIMTIPILINSPTVFQANQNLAKAVQYNSDDIADGRYGACMSQLGRIFKKYDNRPKYSVVLQEMLDFDAIMFPKNSFFLHDTNKKRAEMKTNDRSINASAWISSVAKTFNKNSGATFAEESEAISTETIAFNELMPLEKVSTESEEIFNLGLIPTIWRKMILDMSSATGVAPFPIFMAFLASLGACGQTKYKIQPKPTDEFHQYTNLAVCMVASSGSKKSDVTSMANRMCKIINKEIKKANARQVMDEQQRLQARIEFMIKQSKSLAANGQMEESKTLQGELAQTQQELESLDIKQMEWMIEMASIQKITLDAKNNQDNGLYFDLDEFKQIQALIRKKGNEEARAFLMKGVDGNKDYSYSTLARGKDYVDRHVISILTSIQPDVLNCHIQDLHNPRLMENDGFYQRFLFCSFGEPSPDRVKDINYSLYEREYNIFRDVFYTKHKNIHVAAEAFHTYDEIRHDIRRRAMPYKNSPIGSFLFKHEGLLCRFACLYEILEKRTGEIKNLNRDAIMKADELLKYMAYDMKMTFKTSMDALDRGDLERAIDLIKTQTLKSGGTLSEWNKSWRTGGSKTINFTKVVNDLEMRGYVSTIQHRENGKIIMVNPKVWIDG